MLLSDDLTQNLYFMAFCATVLTIYGVVYLIKRYKEKKKEETEHKALLKRQQREYEEIYKKKVANLHDDRK